MPKSKNKKKQSDFARVRHKVGKKIPQAANATNTTVKAKRIVLPGQTLGADRSERALTSRGLAIEELLGQLAHYSGRVRREALGGLQELLQDNPWLVPLHAARLVAALAPLQCDGEREVRGALPPLLRGALLPALPPPQLAPFIPLLVLHSCSAMTHLDESVRRDALPPLQLLLAAAPRCVLACAPAALLRHYSDLLASGPGGVAWRPAPLRAVAAGLAQLLSALLTQLGCGEEARAEAEAEAEPGRPLFARRAAPPPAAAAFPHAEVSEALASLCERLGVLCSQLAPAQLDPSGACADTLEALSLSLACLRRAHAALCASARAAAAPGAGGAGGAGAAARCAAASAAAAAARARLLPLLRRAFPATPAAAQRGAEARAAVAELNLACCEMLLGDSCEPQPAAGAAARAAAAAAAAQEEHLRAAAADWLAGALAEAAPTRGGAEPPQPRSALPRLLRLAEGVLLGGRAPAAAAAREQVLSALRRLWQAAPPRAPERTAALPLLCRLLAARAAPPDARAEWLSALPRLLFELRGQKAEASTAALRALRAAAAGGADAPALAALEPQLAPFFWLGGAAEAPLARLPPTARAEAAALLAALPRVGEALGAAALAAARAGGGAQAGLLAAAMAVACGASLAQRAAWLRALLLGEAGGGWAAAAAEAAAARAAMQAADWRLWEVLASARPPAPPPRRQALGLLLLAADAAAAPASDASSAEGAAEREASSWLPSVAARFLLDGAAAAGLRLPPPFPPAAGGAEDDPGPLPALLLLQRRAQLLPPTLSLLGAAGGPDGAALSALAALVAAEPLREAMLGAGAEAWAAVEAAAAAAGPTGHVELVRCLRLSLEHAGLER